MRTRYFDINRNRPQNAKRMSKVDVPALSVHMLLGLTVPQGKGTHILASKKRRRPEWRVNSGISQVA